MKKWSIADFAHTLAERMCDERWPNADWNAGARDIVVKDLVGQIKYHAKALGKLRAISPLNPSTGSAIDPLSAQDETYILTRADADELTNYIRSDDQAKRDFPENFAKRESTGRYLLMKAAAIVEAETGERYEKILDRFMNDAADGVLPTYEPGWSQRIEYVATRQPRQIDEALWSDLNKSLKNAKISFRFPAPRKRRRDLLDPAIDKALAQAGTAELQPVWLMLERLARGKEWAFCPASITSSDGDNYSCRS
jgi:hypothetical protein